MRHAHNSTPFSAGGIAREYAKGTRFPSVRFPNCNARCTLVELSVLTASPVNNLQGSTAACNTLQGSTAHSVLMRMSHCVLMQELDAGGGGWRAVREGELHDLHGRDVLFPPWRLPDGGEVVVPVHHHL